MTRTSTCSSSTASALPYVPGAEAASARRSHLDPVVQRRVAGVRRDLPGLTLRTALRRAPVEELADLVDGDPRQRRGAARSVRLVHAVVRRLGGRDVVAALQALPMVDRSPARRPIAGARVKRSRTARIPDGDSRPCRSSPRPTASTRSTRGRWRAVQAKACGSPTSSSAGGTNHEELLTARIRSPSVFGAAECRRSITARLSPASSSAPTTASARSASCRTRSSTLVTDDRGRVGEAATGAAQLPSRPRQLDAAATSCLLEVAATSSRRPTRMTCSPDILVEFDPRAAAIGLAALRGITVIEPAGNGGVDLDQFPVPRPHAAGVADVLRRDRRRRRGTTEPTLDTGRGHSSFGSRVDCFAAGSEHPGAVERGHGYVSVSSAEPPARRRSSPAWPPRCRR